MLRPLASSTSMKRGASGPGGWSNTMSTCRWGLSVLLLLLEVNVLRPDGAPSAAVLEEVEAVGDIVSSAGHRLQRRFPERVSLVPPPSRLLRIINLKLLSFPRSPEPGWGCPVAPFGSGQALVHPR